MGMAAALRAGVIWDNTFNRFDPAASFGGYKESGFGREGGPSGMAAYLTRRTRRPAMITPRGRQDLQALHRRRLPALGVGPDLSGAGRIGRVPGQCGSGIAEGCPGRGGRGPQGFRFLVEGDAVQPRTGDLPGRRDARGPVGPVHRADHDQYRGRGRRRPGPRSRPPSTGWCTTPDGPTSSRRCWAAPTRCRGRTSPTRRPSRPGWWRSWRPPVPRCSGLVSVVAPVITSGNSCVVVAAEPDPCVAIAFAEVLATSDVPAG